MSPRRGNIVLTPLFILAAIFLFFFAPSIFTKTKLPDIASEIPKIAEVAKEIKKEATKAVSAPAPLRVKRVAVPVSTLTRSGVIFQTNLQRKAEGRLALSENAKLNQAAALKVADMFKRQFFAHIAPTGEGAGDLVERSSYKYLSVGENLALGNFSDDKDLVEAWMNSPGHRANILEAGFQEIGVAVGEGTFEGEKTWLAVQIFAKPSSACPQPDDGLKLLIDSSETKIEEMTQTANTLRAQLESEDPKTKNEVEEYNQKVAEYNGLIKSINSLITEVKDLIAKYNLEVRDFNACVAQ